MYGELMGVPFPGADKSLPADKATFDQRAVERCWARIRDTARKVKPDCILWPNGLQSPEPGRQWIGCSNEGPDVRAIEATAKQFDYRPIRLIQNQVGWAEHDARRVFSKPKYRTWDFYGFAAPYDELPAFAGGRVPGATDRRVQRHGPDDDQRSKHRRTGALLSRHAGGTASGMGLATAKPAKASSVWGPGYEADQAFDGDDSTRWGAAPGSRSGWLEVDLGSEQTVTRAYIDEAGFSRTRRFELQARQGDGWTNIATGTLLGDKRGIPFQTPVKARIFRLDILEASEVPTISEFPLFGSEPSPP